MKKTKYSISTFIINFSLLFIIISLFNYSIPITTSLINNISLSKNELPSLSPILKKVIPTVVTIHVFGTHIQNHQLPEEFKFFFGPHFPSQQKKSYPFTGLGSGVIIDAQKGYVITNNHVIEKAKNIKIELYNGKHINVKLIGSDKQTDIALLQVINLQDLNFKSKDLTAIKLADSDKLNIGDFTIAVGNSFGLGQTATSGIISALGRNGLNLEGIENFIQTDASINKGSSGGALVNLNGELIGINTAILTPGSGNVGIGFAIPSNMVKLLSNQLIKYGKIKRGILGIKGMEMFSDISEALNINIHYGAFINEVVPNSPAYKAGILAGDVIIAVNDKKIHNFTELRAIISSMEINKKIKIIVLRKTKTIETNIVLKDLNSQDIKNDIVHTSFIGATLSNGIIKGIKGIKIDDVLPNSTAFNIGLMKGDLIININTRKTENLNQFYKIINSKPAILALNVLRGDQKIYVLLRGTDITW